MTQHMSLQMRRCCEETIALFATKRFFSGMNQHMFLEISSLIGGVSALCASERLLTSVTQHMTFQMARPITCVVTLVATVGLRSIIRTLLGMSCKIVNLHFHFFLKAICARREGN